MRTALANLLLPPTGLLLLLAVGLSLRGRWHRLGRRLGFAALIAVLLLGMPAVSDGLLATLETGLPAVPPADHPPQAIVVLGAEAIRTRGADSGVRPGLLTLDRLRTAAALHRRTGLPILVTGGTAEGDMPAVARIMAQSLTEDFATPPRWIEPASADTWQNARFSAAILRPLGITSVYVVTHAWHMRRALVAFDGTGLQVTAAPTPLDDPFNPYWSDLIPRAGGWQNTYFAAHEWIGRAWYGMR